MCLRFYPDIPCRRARFEHYREAWHLLQGEAGRKEETNKKEPGKRTTTRRTVSSKVSITERVNANVHSGNRRKFAFPTQASCQTIEFMVGRRFDLGHPICLAVT
jgi:hypothetical protein